MRERHIAVDSRIVLDWGLSLRAVGLYLFLLTLPDDFGISPDRLAQSKLLKEGRDAIRTALLELEAAGLVRPKRIQDDAGRWRRTRVVQRDVDLPPEVRL